MSFKLKPLQELHLQPLKQCNVTDILNLCSSQLDDISSGTEVQSTAYEDVANKYKDLQISKKDLRQGVEAIISLIIDAVKANSDTVNVENALKKSGFQQEYVTALGELIQSRRSTISDFIKMTSRIRSYHLVDLDWRLEVRIASRALREHQQIVVTLKLHLRTDDPRNISPLNSSIADKISSRPNASDNSPKGGWYNNRREVVVQTNLSSLIHMIHTLEEALMESRSRRIRNIRTALR